MAHQVPEFKHRRGKYPWDEWLNGAIWVVTKGEDFDCQTDSFVAALDYACKTRKLKYQTSIDGDNVTFQSYEV